MHDDELERLRKMLAPANAAPEKRGSRKNDRALKDESIAV
jgi:hypothetical protein